MQFFERDFLLNTPDATVRFARSLGESLRAGDVILLYGNLGSGKTHFARALIKHRLSRVGLDEDVPSPTYSLVQTYDDGDVEIWHADLYRLSNPDDVQELGLADAFESAICLIEWPECLGPEVAERALSISFSTGVDEDQRKVRLKGQTARWQGVVAALNIS